MQPLTNKASHASLPILASGANGVMLALLATCYSYYRYYRLHQFLLLKLFSLRLLLLLVLFSILGLLFLRALLTTTFVTGATLTKTNVSRARRKSSPSIENSTSTKSSLSESS